MRPFRLYNIWGSSYPVKRIRQFVAVQMGSETKEADIIVYDDDALKSPLIVTECKKPDVSELEFRRAADQAVSYAVAEGARYVWVTSKLKNEYFEIPAKKPKDRITIPDVPQFGVTELARFKFAVGGGTTKNGQKLFPLELVTQDELTRRFHDGTSYEINDKIIEMMSDCGLLIGNLTHCNPNVYHEVGFVMGKANRQHRHRTRIGYRRKVI